MLEGKTLTAFRLTVCCYHLLQGRNTSDGGHQVREGATLEAWELDPKGRCYPCSVFTAALNSFCQSGGQGGQGAAREAARLKTAILQDPWKTLLMHTINFVSPLHLPAVTWRTWPRRSGPTHLGSHAPCW